MTRLQRTARTLARATVAGLVAASLCTPLGASAASETPAPLKQFIERFQRAFSDDDQQAVLDLFRWSEIDAEDRYRISLLITRDLRDRLVATRLEPAANVESRPPLNLPVVAQLRARFISPNGVAHDSVHQLGLIDGRIYIALPVSGAGDRSI